MSLRNKYNTVLITGSSGMLGKDIFSAFLKTNKYWVYGVDKKLNIGVKKEYQIIGDLINNNFLDRILREIKPDIIIHCAAIVNLSLCEENKELASDLHINVTQRLANYNRNNTKIIYISTDSVFDGKKGNYSEEDETNPLNYYAYSKLEGENVVKKNPNHIIVRTNIFGFNIPLRNSLAEWTIKNIELKKEISGFTDVFFNAIYTKHLANIISKLISVDFKGLINIASQNHISKYRFLRKIALELGYNENIVKESSVNDVRFLIRRPKNTYLNVNRLKKLVKVPYIEEGIKDMIIDYKKCKRYENY